MTQLRQILLDTLSPIQNVRELATQQLEQASNENTVRICRVILLQGMYLSMLAAELSNESSESLIRVSAGLALKNALKAKDLIRRDGLIQKWIILDASLKAQIKGNVLSSLGSKDSQAATAAAQSIEAIAYIELARGEWPELLTTLLGNMTNSNSTGNLRKSTLEAIGFICEELDVHVLESKSNELLTAIVQGARKEETDMAVKKAAITALYVSLEFAKKNFDVDGERDFIMRVVIDATQCPDGDVSVAAFECLVKIMQLYYSYMVSYMNTGLYMLTVTGMKCNNEKIQLQAIELWSTVCEIESEYNEDGEVHYHFADTAVVEIVPVLLWLLTQQDEHADADEWTVSIAAGTCLQLMASCVGNRIVNDDTQLIAFVRGNVQNEDWHLREASLMAFGSLLEGVDSNHFGPFIAQMFPALTYLMGDPRVEVKDTCAWVIGQICQYHLSVADTNMISEIIQRCVHGLSDHPRVASNCAYSLGHLAEASDESLQDHVTPYFETVIGALLAASQRNDGSESNLRLAVFYAISSFVTASGPHNDAHVIQIVDLMLVKLESSLALASQAVGIDDLMNVTELQSNVFTVLEASIKRLDKNVLPAADKIMSLILSVLDSSSSSNAAVIDDAFAVVKELAMALEKQFARYISSFNPFLLKAFSSTEEHQILLAAVVLIGDFSQALGSEILPFVENYMSVLWNTLQNPNVERRAKTLVISTFGDIALAIESAFIPFLPQVMSVLTEAASIQVDKDDFEESEYLFMLYENILEAYTSIVQALKDPSLAPIIVNYLPNISAFLSTVVKEQDRPESMTKAAVALIGDLGDGLGKQVHDLYRLDWVKAFVKSVIDSKDLSPSTKELAHWTSQMMKKIRHTQ